MWRWCYQREEIRKHWETHPDIQTTPNIESAAFSFVYVCREKYKLGKPPLSNNNQKFDGIILFFFQFKGAKEEEDFPLYQKKQEGRKGQLGSFPPTHTGEGRECSTKWVTLG